MLGGIAGIFLSIYLQNIIIRAVGMADYVKFLFDFNDNNDISSSVITNIIISIAIFSVIGALIGYMLDKQKQKDS